MTSIVITLLFALPLVLLGVAMRLICPHCRVAFQEKRVPAFARIQKKGGRG